MDDNMQRMNNKGLLGPEDASVIEEWQLPKFQHKVQGTRYEIRDMRSQSYSLQVKLSSYIY
jgi:hypothetical protein